MIWGILGDLFVSLAGQNGVGGYAGEIDVVNSSGQLVAIFDQGTLGSPLNPRGLDFVNGDTLLAANADPEIDLVTPVSFSAVPEPGSMAVLGAGLVCLAVLRRRRMGLYR